MSDEAEVSRPAPAVEIREGNDLYGGVESVRLEDHESPTPEPTEPKAEPAPDTKAETKDDAGTPVQPVEATTEATGTEATTPESKAVYTPEEIAKILAEDGELDSSRLTPEGQLIAKSFQKGLTPKLQERSELKQERVELKRQVDELKAWRTAQEQQHRQVQQERNLTPEQVIEREFFRNPQNAINTINSRIAAEMQKDPYSPDIATLMAMKDSLIVKHQVAVQRSFQQREMQNAAHVAVRRAIPDFDTKAAELDQIAYDMGFSQEEVRRLSDPIKAGPMAVKFVNALNKVHEKLNQAKPAPVAQTPVDALAAKQVAVKKEPTKVESAGAGSPHNTKPSGAFSPADMIAERQKRALT